ncbi:hypothetical protein PY32053_02044 [Paracoccus yeei]|uniref:Uncharacterized protein n=1 Tax=Paracoccus yeei TaxID=147645 RepID=A0A386UMT4_9RHOB|nr:hypothetical protein PY32053_02044 [Paracoccus yeei]
MHGHGDRAERGKLPEDKAGKERGRCRILLPGSCGPRLTLLGARA